MFRPFFMSVPHFFDFLSVTDSTIHCGFSDHANNFLMDMAFLWSDLISFSPTPVLLEAFPSTAEASSMFDHLCLLICVLPFLRFHAPFLSTSRSIFEHVYS